MKPVVVVGAGVVGASVAYHLAAAGVPVTLVDRLRMPAAGVTGASFAWIGDRGGDWPGGAADLRAFVRADHERLAATVDGVAVRWTGSLRWPGTAPEDGQSWVGPAEIAKLEPCLATVPDRAVHTPSDGGVDPVAMTSALVAAASRLEARVLTGTEVDDPREFGTTVVLAAGTGVASLSARVGAPVAVPPSPACLVRARGRPGVIRTVVATPDFEARQLAGGEVLVTVPFTPSRTRGSRATPAPSRTPAAPSGTPAAPSGSPAAASRTPGASPRVPAAPSGTPAARLALAPPRLALPPR